MLDEFLTYLSTEKRYSPHTVLAYKTDLTQAQEFFQDQYQTDFNQVNSLMIRSWVVTCVDSGNQARTIHRKVSSLKSLFKYLLKEGIIKKSPATDIPLPKIKKQLPVFVEESKLMMLLDMLSFSEDFEGKRDQLILEILYCTGIRESELIGLELKSVDFGSQLLKVLGKRNKERLIPISSQLIETIKSYLPYRNEKAIGVNNKLLITSKGESLYPQLVYRIVNQHLSVVSSQKKKSPHVLRHSFATHMLNHGAELNSVKELLGHANLNATQVYTHTTIDQLKKIYEQAHPRA